MDISTVSSSIAVMTTVAVRDEDARAFASWQAAFTRAVSAQAGFVSIEVIPAFSGSIEWRIIQRFRSTNLLEAWRHSEPREALLAELDRMRSPAETSPEEEVASDFKTLSCMTEVIATSVEPGREDEFHAWAEEMQAAQATFPGYMGTLIQAPASSDVPHWTTLVRFSTTEQLDGWLNSAARKAILEKADPQISRWRSQRLPGPFAGWFPSSPERAPPPAWKQTMLVLLVLFPVVMLELRFLSPVLAGLPVSVATFIGNAISVGLVSWPLMQGAVFCLKWWLQPDPTSRARSEVLGIATMAGAYAAEIFVLTFLFD